MHAFEEAGGDAGDAEAGEEACGYSDGGDDEAFGEDVGEDAAGLSAEGHADAEFAGASADGEGENAGDADDGDEQGYGGESAEDDGVEAVGGEDFGADVVEGAGALDGLVDGHGVDGPGDLRNQRVGVLAGAYQEAAAPAFLIDGLVDGHEGLGNDVFVVEVRDDADDAAGLWTDADELDDAVGPAQFAIEGGLAGKERVGDAFADDDDALGAILVGFAEIAALEQGHAQGVKEAGRDGAEAGAWIFLAVFALGSVDGEHHADGEGAAVTPGNAEAGGDVFDAGESSDVARDVAVELVDLLGRFAVGHDGEIDGEDVGGGEGRLRLFENEEGAHERGGSGEKQEGCGDLGDGEDTQAAAAAGGGAAAARVEAEAVRGVGGGQAGDIGQADGGDEGEGDSEPDEVEVEAETLGAWGEAHGVVAENNDHGRGEQERGDDSADAEDEALCEQGTAECGGACAEGGADGELGFAADGAGEDEIGDVGAGDDEE